jgi:hypothetical protein
MNTGKKYSRMLFLVLLLAAVVAGCGESHTNNVPPNSAKAITAFSLNGASGAINESAKTIAVTMPFSTPSVTALVATFSTTGASVMVGATTQISGITPNDFTNPMLYTVTATDGTMVNYTATVTVALGSAKSITAYSIAGQVSSSITGTAIAVTMPFGTADVTALVATFSTTGAFVTVDTTTQTSGTTPNDFTGPVIYTVTAADTTTQTYTVTVTVAPSSAKDITAYSLAGQDTSTIIGTAITVTMPFSTPSVTALVATFSTTGASVHVGSTLQTSGTTTNDFTSPVIYTVTAADTTTQTYTVTVTLAAAPAPAICTGTVTDCVDLGNAAIFSILTGTGITDVPASPITGNIGTSGSSGASITVPCTDVLTGQVFTDDDTYPGVACTSPDKTLAGLAVVDMGTAYTDATVKTSTAACPGGGAFNVPPLVPGVYTCVDVTIPAHLTLNGSSTDVWVFQIAGTLTQSADMIVSLLGGALPQNVFWQVSGAVTIGTNAHIEGVILSQAQINMLAGSSIKGRLLSQAGVALDTATVTEP